MKLLTFRSRSDSKDTNRFGALLSDQKTIVDLAKGARRINGSTPSYLDHSLSWLDAWPRSFDETRVLLKKLEDLRPQDSLYQLTDVILAAPVKPRSIRDFMAFEKHVVQAIRQLVRKRSRLIANTDEWLHRYAGRGFIRPPRVWFERPIYYKGNPLNVIGHDAQVMWPSYTEYLDYELEFGVFIGGKGRNISEKRASEYIAGYTIFNDFSARDIQFKEMEGRLGPTKGKDFDTSNVLGPYLVTPDEVPDPYALDLVARINGETWSSDSSKHMHRSFDELIAYISKDETLHPGEFIGAGTVGGGCGLELDRWIQSGDVVELEVKNLGILRNQITRISP